MRVHRWARKTPALGPPIWGEPGSTVDYEPASFPAVPQIATSDPGQFKLEGTAGLPNAAGDTGPPGCDVGLLVVASPETIGRADALSKRPKVPLSFAVQSTGDSNVREINLDNPKRRELENLARFINHSDWKSGTRFLVRGTNKKTCGPIHVTNRSLCIEFVDETPPLLTFEDTRGESRDHPAFITVTGGTIEIVHANFRVGSSAKHLPHWLLDVKDGSFSIRDSIDRRPAVREDRLRRLDPLFVGPFRRRPRQDGTSVLRAHPQQFRPHRQEPVERRPRVAEPDRGEFRPGRQRTRVRPAHSRDLFGAAGSRSSSLHPRGG